MIYSSGWREYFTHKSTIGLLTIKKEFPANNK